MVAITVGRPGGDRVVIEVERRLFPRASASDGNALACRVSLRTGGFSGEFATTMFASDFDRFLSGVRQMNRTLEGSADLDTIEGQLSVTIECISRLGTLRASGVARDVAGTGNRLDFELGEFDQTDLPHLIETLENVLAAFPVVTGEAGNQPGRTAVPEPTA